jgi:hypothetical protein
VLCQDGADIRRWLKSAIFAMLITCVRMVCMPHVLLNQAVGGRPLFAIEHGVGLGMANKRGDVALVQFFLKALLHCDKVFTGGIRSVTLKPPGGSPLNVSGVWDSVSATYLGHWEGLVWAPSGAIYDFEPWFPGKIVGSRAGGEKINDLNEMSRPFLATKRTTRSICQTRYSQRTYGATFSTKMPEVAGPQRDVDDIRGVARETFGEGGASEAVAERGGKPVFDDKLAEDQMLRGDRL